MNQITYFFLIYSYVAAEPRFTITTETVSVSPPVISSALGDVSSVWFGMVWFSLPAVAAAAPGEASSAP